MRHEPETEAWVSQLQAAQLMPEMANLPALLAQIDREIAPLDKAEQLQIAGEVVLQLAELCALRAERLMNQWEEAGRDPIVEQGFFSDLVRQTMAVDLTDLMEPAPPRQPRKPRTKPSAPAEGSIVQEMDKAVVLAMAEQWESQVNLDNLAGVEGVNGGWAIAHEESVSDWVRAIINWMQHHQCRVNLETLAQALEISRVDLWLGLLFGSFELEPQGSFYGSDVWIKMPTLNRAPLPNPANNQSS